MKKKLLKIITDEHRDHRWTPMVNRCYPKVLSVIKTLLKLSILFILKIGLKLISSSPNQQKTLKHSARNSIKIGVHRCSSVVIFSIIFLLLNVSIYAQATVPVKEEKKEKSNIEIMQENEANVEKDRAAREKEPLTGYDAETNSKKSIKENNEKYSNFWVVGGSIGSPASGNINVGYYFTNFVLRASGMRYSPHWNGIQGDIGYSFWKTSVVAHSVSLVFGDFNVRPFDPQTPKGGQNKFERDGIPGYTNQPQTFTDTLIRAYITNQDPTLGALLDYQYRTRQYANLHQQYVGLTYDLLLGNFFLQLGMGYGRGDYRNPQLLLQMGYLFDFGRTAN